MSTLEGVHTRIQGKAATTSQRLVPWVLLPHLAPSPEEPRTSIRTEASKAYGQLLLHSPLPWTAAPTTGCLGLFMPPSSVHFLRLQAWGVFGFFSYQRQLTSRRNQARVSYKINLIWRLFFLEKYQRISTLLLFKSRIISGANSLKKCPQLYII